MATRQPLIQARRRSRDVILFDHRERAFNATASVSAWRGANQSRRTRSWNVTDAAINALLAGDVAELRRRSRDVVRKSAWADSASDSFVANAIGNGIVPRPLTPDDTLRRQLMEAWAEFVDNCDADGTQNFYGLQALACRSFREGGDCFIRLRPRQKGELAIPLQLQVLEAELVDPAFDQLQLIGGRIQAGIEFNGINQRVAYHFWRAHPGEMASLRSGERVRVPADSVMHLFEVLRPGQIRGVPGLSAAIAKIWELDKYDDAELVRKQVAAMFAGFITKPDSMSNPLDAGVDGGGEDEEGRPLATLEPGTMQELEPGFDVKFSEPADVGANYDPFLRSQLRQVAAAGKVTYEGMTGDLSGVNFSSIRAGMIEMNRRMTQRQRNVIIFQLCRPTWRRFVEAAVLSGRVPLPEDPELMRSMSRVAWTPTPGREYVDPEKEVRAIVARMRSGLISRSKAVAEHGFDAEELDREIQSDNRRADELGLRFDGDGRFPVGGARPGGGQPGGDAGGGGGGTGQPTGDPLQDGADDAAAEEMALVMLQAIRRLAGRGELHGV